MVEIDEDEDDAAQAMLQLVRPPPHLCYSSDPLQSSQVNDTGAHARNRRKVWSYDEEEA